MQGFRGYAIKLANGTFIFVDQWFPDYGTWRTIYIDINGKKKPNMLGKDLFAFVITKDGLKPYRYYEPRTNLVRAASSQSCNKNSIEFPGLACAALIMLDGWKISEDYPW